MENIMEIVEFGLLALGCIVAALLLKYNRSGILRYAAELVNAAEVAIQGSGMGAEKKALVLAQLEAAGIHINSGYRTEAYDESLKDASQYSQHKYGLAADITIQGVTPAQVAAYAETLLVGTGGIGVYKNFTHIDVRKVKIRC